MKRFLIPVVLAWAGCGASEDLAADKTSSDESRVESKTNGMDSELANFEPLGKI